MPHLSPAELEHSMSITASSNNPVTAGSSLTLNCTSTSNLVPHLKWIGLSDLANFENVSEHLNGESKSAILTFDPLQTSHAGNYTCVSIIEENVSKLVANHFITVESKFHMQDFVQKRFVYGVCDRSIDSTCNAY